MTDVSCIVACALPFDERIRCIAQKNTNTSNIVYLFRNLAGIYIEIYIYLGSSWFHHGSSLVPAGSKWFLLVPAGSGLVPAWFQLGSSLVPAGSKWFQLVPAWFQLVPSWFQVGSKLVPSWFRECATSRRMHNQNGSWCLPRGMRRMPPNA